MVTQIDVKFFHDTHTPFKMIKDINDTHYPSIRKNVHSNKLWKVQDTRRDIALGSVRRVIYE